MKTTTLEVSKRLKAAILAGKIPEIENSCEWVQDMDTNEKHTRYCVAHSDPFEVYICRAWTRDELWDALPVSIINKRKTEYRKQVGRFGFAGYESAGHLDLETEHISFTPDGLAELLLWLADNHPESLISKP